MNMLSKISILVISGLVVLVSSSLYVISEVERGVTLRFGEMVQADIKPGWHLKAPFIDNVRRFDARILTVDAQPASFFTIEKKNNWWGAKDSSVYNKAYPDRIIFKIIRLIVVNIPPISINNWVN